MEFGQFGQLHDWAAIWTVPEEFSIPTLRYSKHLRFADQQLEVRYNWMDLDEGFSLGINGTL